MDEFEKMMAEFDEWAEDAKVQLEASGRIDSSKLNAFVSIIEELVQIKHEYADRLTQLRTSAEEKIVRHAYSKGGIVIYRGFYCPSPVLDLVVGGMKRGRLFKKKIPKLGEYSYEYGFDQDEKMLRVKRANEFEGEIPENIFDEEYLIYVGNVEYGLQFNYLGGLDAVSRCTYENGKLMKYEQCYCGMEEFADLHYEEYRYEDDLLSEVDFFGNITPRLGLYEENRLHVEYDDDGNIVRIIISEMVDGEFKKTFVTHVKPPKKSD
ncbi:hypothetical protein [Paenibacillus sp. LHD-38]|uniref:hypothetical protein n=1 Tax=Paenibacillus sp. LHD-38 TaxID=3072143 RepID=UPI00280DE46A|nr:hypothetical protein [Paenibacillus sp. LHD-38]MDQ8739434.1 hypothetical protein [Paenibacillus sp. LHD-38]